MSSSQLPIGTHPRLNAGAGTTRLSYAVRTHPAPLTVSLRNQPPLLGTLELVVTNPTAGPVSLRGIALSIQVGADASHLVTTADGSGCTVSDTTNWRVTPTVNNGQATWRVLPAQDTTMSLGAGDALVVELSSLAINQAVGTSSLRIQEGLADGTVGEAAFDVTKFPYGFFFEGLTAVVSSGSEPVPVAQVANGTRVKLLWISSVVEPSAFAVLYSTNEGQQTGAVSNAGEWTSPVLSRDTVFVVRVQVSAGGQTLAFSLATSVSVQDADLSLGSASVVRTLSVGKGLGEILRVDDKGARVTKQISAAGPVAMMGAPVELKLPADSTVACCAAPTDGLVIGWTVAEQCDGYIWGSTATMDISASTFLHTVGLSSQIIHGNFCMPVAKGAPFTIGAYRFESGGRPGPLTFSFHWIPLGVAEPPVLSPAQQSAASPRYEALRVQREPSSADQTFNPKVDNLVDAISDVLGDALIPEKYERLRVAVHDLFRIRP